MVLPGNQAGLGRVEGSIELEARLGEQARRGPKDLDPELTSTESLAGLEGRRRGPVQAFEVVCAPLRTKDADIEGAVADARELEILGDQG